MESINNEKSLKNITENTITSLNEVSDLKGYKNLKTRQNILHYITGRRPDKYYCGIFNLNRELNKFTNAPKKLSNKNKEIYVINFFKELKKNKNTIQN